MVELEARETAEDHLAEAHPGRTTSTASEVLAVATGEIRQLQAALAMVTAECDVIRARLAHEHDEVADDVRESVRFIQAAAECRTQRPDRPTDQTETPR
ncbi:hypothetical protein [Embleya sp. NPDC059237]|uniref:hypothetical protein n=1 Tax=Embleya sp. NPDC059237 TaxID=3346784 RepID=UPI0036A1E1FE